MAKLMKNKPQSFLQTNKAQLIRFKNWKGYKIKRPDCTSGRLSQKINNFYKT